MRLVRAWVERLRHGRHPEQYRHVSPDALRWVWTHRAVTPGYLIRYLRLLRLRLLHPDVITTGMVFLGPGVRIETTPGYGRVMLGAFVHIGEGSVLRAHEGTLRLGDKVVLGTDVRVNCWLDVHIGAGTLLADWSYVADFDHGYGDNTRAIKDQGIRKSPVRIGAGSWVGLRATVLRGTEVGAGTVIGAHAVVKGRFGDNQVLAGVPAKPVTQQAAARPRVRPRRRTAGTLRRAAP